jgi:hypothetical protein
MIIDTHQHFWHLGEGDAKGPEDYKIVAAPEGVAGTILRLAENEPWTWRLRNLSSSGYVEQSRADQSLEQSWKSSHPIPFFGEYAILDGLLRTWKKAVSCRTWSTLRQKTCN